MLRLLLLFTLTSTALPLFSQGWTPVGARAASLAGTAVCMEDVWAFHHNPGALGTLKSFSAGAYYEARFLARELQTQGIAAAMPLKKGVLSVGGQFYGYEHYRNTRAGVGYSMGLGEKIFAGVQINLQRLAFSGNYGSTMNATFEAGILAVVSEKWKFGVSAMNVGRQKLIASQPERYTTVLRLGAHYLPSPKVAILAEVEKQVTTPVSFKGAVEYMPIESFVLRFGAHSGPAEFAFGLGYRKKGFFIDAGTAYHQVLGWTPNVGFTYQFQQHATR